MSFGKTVMRGAGFSIGAGLVKPIGWLVLLVPLVILSLIDNATSHNTPVPAPSVKKHEAAKPAHNSNGQKQKAAETR